MQLQVLVMFFPSLRPHLQTKKVITIAQIQQIPATIRTESRKVVIQLMKSVVTQTAVLVEPKESKRSPSCRWNRAARSQAQAIQDMARTFSALGQQQQKRSESMVEAEKERQAESFKFQREQTELNRQHELKMVEIIMKFANPQPPVHYGSTQVAQQVQQPTSHDYYNHTTTFNQLPQVRPDPSQMASPQTNHLPDLDQYQQPASGNSWH